MIPLIAIVAYVALLVFTGWLTRDWLCFLVIGMIGVMVVYVVFVFSKPSMQEINLLPFLLFG